MTTVEHLTELRYRIVVSGLTFLACAVVGWFLVPSVLKVFVSMVGPLVFVAPAEAFVSHLKIAASIGLVLASPVIFWQAWQFLLPALFPHEREMLLRYLPAAVVLFCIGLVFAYTLILPIALRFFLGFGNESLQPTLAIGRFLGFFLTMTLPFGLVFQIPLVILGLIYFDVVSLEWLRKQRKYVIFAAFVIGAVLTPADAASQILMAVPMIVLYEIALWIAGRQQEVRRAEARPEPEA